MVTFYCDCDFLFLDDIKELFDLADPKYAAMVVKHDYKPKARYKDGWSNPVVHIPERTGVL